VPKISNKNIWKMIMIKQTKPNISIISISLFINLLLQKIDDKNILSDESHMNRIIDSVITEIPVTTDISEWLRENFSVSNKYEYIKPIIMILINKNVGISNYLSQLDYFGINEGDYDDNSIESSQKLMDKIKNFSSKYYFDDFSTSKWGELYNKLWFNTFYKYYFSYFNFENTEEIEILNQFNLMNKLIKLDEDINNSTVLFNNQENLQKLKSIGFQTNFINLVDMLKQNHYMTKYLELIKEYNDSGTSIILNLEHVTYLLVVPKKLKNISIGGKNYYFEADIFKDVLNKIISIEKIANVDYTMTYRT